ncbi:MAG: hypothetical protein WBW48_07100 [Anaerolineae bacterium]
MPKEAKSAILCLANHTCLLLVHPVDDLLEALKEGGLPCIVEELQWRFAEFVRRAMRGHDSRNTRLTLEQ